MKDAKLSEDRFKEKEFFETSNSPYKYIDEAGEHLHTFENQPLIGTSSVASVISKPGLPYWASGLACAVFGWTHKGDAKKGFTDRNLRLQKAEEMREKIEYMSTSDFLDLLDTAYSAHAKTLKTSAKKGTDMHAELEIYVKDCIRKYKGTPVPYLSVHPVVTIFSTWASSNVKRFLWSEGHCFSKRMWTGGICDLGYEKLDGTYGIMDFKSSKEAYLTQFWQCAGYDIQVSENGVFDRNGNKIFTLDKPITEYAVFPFGMPNPYPQFNVDIAGGREAFECEVKLYKKLNI